MAQSEPLFATPGHGAKASGRLTILAFVATVVATAALAAAFPDEVWGIAVTGGLVALTFALIWFLIPTRYEVHADGLEIHFRIGDGWHLPWETVREVRPAEWYKSFAYVGMRFATAPGQSVEVVREGANIFRRPNLIISPRERDEFVEAARRAMAG